MAFSKYKPFMAYVSDEDMKRMKSLAKKTKISLAQIVREGIAMRIAGENAFAEGYNQGINKAISVIHDMQPAQMRFPSGVSFAELTEAELIKHMWRDAEIKA